MGGAAWAVPAASWGHLHKRDVLFVSLPDEHLSTHQFRLTRDIEADESIWHLRDEGSTNGTWVNGERTMRATLCDGDIIGVGSVVLVFRDTAPEPAPEPTDEPGPVMHELATFHPGFATAVARIERMVCSGVPILITGETGVGKEVAAQAIHRLSGRKGRIVAVNCGAFPPNLVSSEFLGVTRGAFSGANSDRPGLARSADKGTLFLDEIAELPMEAQAALLRVLQEHTVLPLGASRPVDVDIRVLAATHQDLEKRVSMGTFRQDLLARLRGYTLTLPPVRERREDIGLLIARLLSRHAGDRPVRLTRYAAVQLFMYAWPENVRELEKTLQAALLFTTDDTIRLTELPAHVARAAPPKLAALQERVRALHREHNGNKSAMARELGTSRGQVRRLLERFGLED